MLTTHKISADFFDDDFELIAIHSGLEDYAMTYAINVGCGLFLKRMANDLQIDKNRSFPIFDWEDELKDVYWTLVSNKCIVEEEVPSTGLFGTEITPRTNYLMEERKEVDFFLKVEGAEESTVDEHIKAIKRISKVITAYPIETQTLKSKRNIIF